MVDDVFNEYDEEIMGSYNKKFKNDWKKLMLKMFSNS
jgi:hypothetical protein